MKTIKRLALVTLLAVPLFAKAKGHLYRLDTHDVITVEFTRVVHGARKNLDNTFVSGEIAGRILCAP